MTGKTMTLSDAEAHQIIGGIARLEANLDSLTTRLLGREGQAGEIPQLHDRVRALEETRDQQSGMLRIISALWALLVFLFGGFEAYERLRK
jgi:hypothetical protein